MVVSRILIQSRVKMLVLVCLMLVVVFEDLEGFQLGREDNAGLKFNLTGKLRLGIRMTGPGYYHVCLKLVHRLSCMMLWRRSENFKAA